MQAFYKTNFNTVFDSVLKTLLNHKSIVENLLGLWNNGLSRLLKNAKIMVGKEDFPEFQQFPFHSMWNTPQPHEGVIYQVSLDVIVQKYPIYTPHNWVIYLKTFLGHKKFPKLLDRLRFLRYNLLV